MASVGLSDRQIIIPCLYNSYNNSNAGRVHSTGLREMRRKLHVHHVTKPVVKDDSKLNICHMTCFAYTCIVIFQFTSHKLLHAVFV